MGGLGLPAFAAGTSSSSSPRSERSVEHHQELKALHEKILKEAKADDAALQKLVAELNKAPEANKVDLEAAILTKLVSEQHQLLRDREALHARLQEFRKERKMMRTSTSSSCTMHGKTGVKGSSAQQ